MISIWALASSLPDAALPWHPYSSFGYSVDPAAKIVRVTPAAAAAGLAPGDRIDLAATTLNNRRYASFFFSPFTFDPGAVAGLTIDRGGRRMPVRVVSSVRERSLPDNISDELLVFAQLAFIVVATALVLIRPNRMTWAFYIYGVAINAGGSALYQAALPFSLFVANLGLSAALSIAGTAAFVIFALRFPTDSPSSLRSRLERLTLLAAVPLMLLAAYAAVAPILWATPTPGLTAFVNVLVVAGYVAGIAAFVATYVFASGDVRHRIQWVIAGFAVGFGGYLIITLLFLSPFASLVSVWLSNALLSLNVVVPIVVAYAIVKHRVIDVKFIVSRALVYGTLTTLVIALLGLVDWLIGQVATQTQLALVASLALAVGTGFILNGVQRSIDQFIDGMLFRRRHLAERRLTRIAAGLPHASSETTVDAMLVDEAADALWLASAALFRRDDRGRFVRTASVGWGDDRAAVLDADDPAILQLQGDRTPLRIHEIRWFRKDIPDESASPVLAMPITARQSLEAVAFYGAHTSGEDIDPNEVRVLGALAVGAAAALDHIEARKLRTRVAELAGENDSLRVALRSRPRE